ncbi:HEXXH motif-containing putative peptide modification protein [Saccharothrix sp. S26]|uniref:aKG-HExxH-type peptide beta-hydroxylase n=1 Tax=Saccharothrix sp. S26 TaxID=2907215 RepID=UPI001F1CE5BC|nr:HEXXH motif-containing putative peptide modification protein [Saccharothrix sp. S26]MCE6994765.1 HEXXH motif-containing putative peptide modification protein [Saccharothrix sp. S26]
MTVGPFRVSASDFTALARGGGGPAVRTLRLARRSRTLLLIRSIAADPAARAAFGLLCEVARVAPGEVDRVLDHPSVGAWATRTAVAMRRGAAARPAELAFTAAAAAVRAGLPVELEFPPVEVFSLPSLGVVVGPGLAYEPLPEIDLGGWSVQVDLWAGGGVPDGLPVAASVDVPRWRDALGAAWELLTRDHPDLAAECAEVVSVVTPMPSSRSGTSSATLADAFGCVFLSPMPDAETVAVTLAHEAQHSKLVALMDLFALVEPGGEALFYAPWREDPRPAAGLLHGTYAHLGVAGFWRARPGPAAQAEYARWRSAALTAAETLLAGDALTPTGVRFVAEMATVLRAWCAEPLPPSAEAVAAAEAAAHRARWQAAHGPLPERSSRVS